MWLDERGLVCPPPSPHGLQWTLSTAKFIHIIHELIGLEWSGVHFGILSPENPTGSGLDSSGLQ